ncbi:hypothetical protein [Novosphingopyxis sp.]|uniref:hypothetical protein n=1 Tax=Novosphingopyxis sp. TaxID=2709690 RepID=UPI003B5B9472
MTTIRTGTTLTNRDIRRLERHGYEILAIETRQVDAGPRETIIWGREDDLGIPEHSLPF